MPVVLPPRNTYLHGALDSRRWDSFAARPGDIVISTSIKAGTTWMQTIVHSLLWPDGNAPGPVNELSIWFEQPARPLDFVVDIYDKQQHRRFVKTHLPAYGLPIHDEVRYIAVARDGRDVFMSLVHHHATMRPMVFELLKAFRQLDPAIPPLDPYDGDLHAYFDRWISQGSFPFEGDGAPWWSHFENVKSWWELRDLPNVLLVHYADLKADLRAEMERVAAFIDVEVPDELWPEVVDRCTFERMRERAGDVVPEKIVFEDDGANFLHKGTNEQWRGVLTDDELARYEARVAAVLPADAAAWMARGRLAQHG